MITRPLDKIDLEVLIFQIAATQDQVILAKNGDLLAPDSDGILAKLINCYNQLFAQENRCFLEEEINYTRALEHKRYTVYQQNFRRNPTVSAFYLKMNKS